MTPKEIVEKVFEDCNHCSPYCDDCMAAAISQAVAEAIEQAAKYAEEYTECKCTGMTTCKPCGIAHGIRALARKGPTP